MLQIARALVVDSLAKALANAGRFIAPYSSSLIHLEESHPPPTSFGTALRSLYFFFRRVHLRRRCASTFAALPPVTALASLAIAHDVWV